MKKILVLLILLSTTSYAEDDGSYFKFGVGIDNSLGLTKMIAGGYQGNLIGFFDYQLETGAFLDNSQPQGLIGFGGASLGISAKTNSGFYAKVFTGPSLITQTDTRLSSILEFNDDIEFGLMDRRGVHIGANFKHMSNAGFWPPNIGRDFMLIKIQIPF
jgi:hypothetical protein